MLLQWPHGGKSGNEETLAIFSFNLAALPQKRVRGRVVVVVGHQWDNQGNRV